MNSLKDLSGKIAGIKSGTKVAWMNQPCMFCSSDNMWRSRGAAAPWCAHYNSEISSSWIHIENISMKLHALRIHSPSGASNNLQICHLDKTYIANSSMHRYEANLLPLKLQPEHGFTFLFSGVILFLIRNNKIKRMIE